MVRKILHIDCNCFYASVEAQRHPELRDKPLAVCGSVEDRHGIVLTANYLAKPRGVKTGMAVWQAKQACPELVVLPPDMPEYIRFSKMAREIYEDYSDQIEPFGLDENWVDVTGSAGVRGDAMAIAQEIRERVRFELGITVSIGVANNKVTAKLGSDYRKPDAITRIERDNYKEIVYPLPVEDLLYVGPATRRKLHGMGIFTIGELAETPLDILTSRFGKIGRMLAIFAQGNDLSPVKHAGHQAVAKSIGNSATPPRDLVSEDDVWMMLLLLSESVAQRMREAGARCTMVELSVRSAKLETFTRQQKLNGPTCASLEIARAAFALFRKSYSWGVPVRSIGVRGAGLEPAGQPEQLSLFADDSRRGKWEQIDKTVDQLRARYGYASIRRAAMQADPLFGRINPKDDHIVHPVGFFCG